MNNMWLIMIRCFIPYPSLRVNQDGPGSLSFTRVSTGHRKIVVELQAPARKGESRKLVVIFIFPLKYFIGAVWFGLPLDQANPQVFLDMAVDGKPLGRVVLELKEDVVPRTA